MMKYISGLIFIALVLESCLCQTLKATFNMAEVKGRVEFTKAVDSNDVKAKWTLTGSGSYTWQLNKFYMNYDRTDKCATSFIGERYGNAGGTVNAGTSESTVSVEVSGLNSIEGRTVFLTDVNNNSVKICATVMSTGKYETSVARFNNGRLFGEVYFRKAVDSINTLVYSDLYLGDLTSTPPQYTWKVFQGFNPKTDCRTIVKTIFNPQGLPGTGCSMTSHSNCAIGELTTKLGALQVGTVKGSAITRYTDSNLPISGENSVVGNTLALLDDAGVVQFCSPIAALQPRHLRADFSRDGTKGFMSFKQPSPFDPTRIEVNLNGLRSRAGGYHVHEYPVPQKVSTDQAVCGASYVRGHFNPFKVVKSAGPAEGVGTNDQYEIGDMSGKFGLLTGKDNISEAYEDWNMPLFGSRSIADKSIVIHSSSTGGARWVCTNIQDMDNVKSAMATFTYPFIGYAIFRQRQSEWNVQDTTIFVQLNTADGTATSSTYDWQISEKKAGVDWMSDLPDRCQSTGNIFNPYGTSTTPQDQYDTQCNEDGQARCISGDMTKKHGQVTIRASDGTAAEHSFTDQFLQLSGPGSIIGKSIVLMNGATKVACATINEVRPRVATVQSWSQGVTGVMRFTQSLGVTEQSTTIDFNLTNLASLAGGYHVHQFPILKGSEGDCSAAMVAGHYNPFNINTNTDPAPTVGTVEQYEVGDLSGKFGYLSGMSDSKLTQDSNLNLIGPLSIVGRSVVIHKMAGGARWSCGNIVEDTSSTGGTLYQAKAVFDNNLRGYVLMSQYMYPDGSVSDTSIEIDLKYADGSSPTMDHNWHVHERYVQGDDMVVAGTCSSTGQHFNPFMVNLKTGYEECGVSNPLRCEVGDQSSKLGTYSIGSGRKFMTDVYLPLNGIYSVVGKSLVFHAEKKGAGRLSCATIMPVGNPAPIKMSITTPKVIDRYQISQALAQQMSMSEWQIITVDLSSTQPDCTDINVYFIGPEANSHKTEFEKRSNEGKFTSFGDYTACSDCALLTSSIAVIGAVVVITKIFF